MKKSTIFRLISGGLAAAVIGAAGMLPVYADLASGDIADAEDVTSFDDGIVTYTVIDDSRFVEITACDTAASFVNIMPEMDGFTVIGVADGAFAGCTQLQSITLPNSEEFTYIGQYAFAECTSLKKITIPESVTEISTGAFAFCSALETVEMGDNITYIGDEAFRECMALTNIALPVSLTEMGAYSFMGCVSLTGIDIPESLTSLGGYTFMGCVSLESFHIPATLESIGDAPFLGCSGLTALTADENHPNYAMNDGILYSKDETILYCYPSSRTDAVFVVPEGVVDIYDGAFFQCSALEEVYLPSTLTTIGSSAFEYCSSLRSVTIPESVTQIMNASFADCVSLAGVTFEGAEDEDEGEGEPLVIGDQAFYVCENLTEVILPKRVTAIGDNAFGVTEITDASGNAIPTALEGFMLRGFEAAESYIKSCKDADLSVGFSPRSFPWKKVVFWVVGAAVVIVIVFFALRIVKNNMMTAEEKEALRQAKAERLAAEEEAEKAAHDDGYKSILGDDEDTTDNEPVEETEEEKAAREAEEIKRFRSAEPSMTHFRGHGE